LPELLYTTWGTAHSRLQQQFKNADSIQIKLAMLKMQDNILDFKLSPCFVLSVLSYWRFPGVWFIFQIICLKDGMDMFRNVGQYKPDAGETPKR
jgi:hypothetical protein